MPSISNNASGGVIRWDADDWLASLVPHQTTSIDRTLTGGKGFAYANAIDPYRSPGYLMPGVKPTDATNIADVTSTLVAGVSDGTSAYCIGDTKLYEFTIGTNTVVNTGSFPDSITNAVQGCDVIYYNIGTNTRLFYRYTKASGGDIGMYDSLALDDDWMSTVPANAATLDTNNVAPLIIGDDDIMYIPDGNNLHAFDGQTGANGTLYKNKLILPKSYVITAVAKLPNFLVLFAHKKVSSTSTMRTECTAFFWDYISADPTYKYKIPGNYVSAAFSDYLGTVGCFVVGQASTILPSRQNKLMIFDGSRFTTLLHLPQNSPINGGVEVAGDVLYWNAGGKLFQYGNPLSGDRRYLNIIAASTGTADGMLKNFTGSSFDMSSGSGAGKGMQRFTSGFNASAQALTVNVTPPFPVGYRGAIKNVVVQYGSTASGGNPLTLTINTNKGQNSAIIVQGKTSVTESTLIQNYLYDVNSAALGKYQFDSVSLEVSYSAGDSLTATPPYLQAVELYYSLEKYT